MGESAGRVGFVREAFAVSQHGGEGVFGKQFFDDLRGEGVRFVGKDGERDAACAEIFEEGGDAVVRVRALLPGGGVFLRKTAQNMIEMPRGLTRSHCTGDEHPCAIADETAHRRIAMGRQAVPCERAVQRRGNAGQGLHQRAIQIKNKRPVHGAEETTGSPR